MTVQNIFYAKRDAKKSVKISIVKYIWTWRICSCRNLSFVCTSLRVVIIYNININICLHFARLSELWWYPSSGEGPTFRPTQCYKFISAGFLLSMIAHILDLFARIPFITPRFSRTCPLLPDRRNEQLPLKELRASMKAPWDVNKTFWLCLLLSPSLPSLFFSQA